MSRDIGDSSGAHKDPNGAYEPPSVPRQYDIALSYSHTTAGGPQSEKLYQIVAIGEGDAQPAGQ